MSAPQGGAQSKVQGRTLSGTLTKTPVPRLLVSASSARVTGTLELRAPGETVLVTMARGLVTKVKTSAPVAYLGSLLYEMGHIDSVVLNDSLLDLSRNRWLHGEILLTRGAITPVHLAEGLHEQTVRKLVHLFSLPAETTYAFESDVDKLVTYGGTDWPQVDPAIAVWRGVRDGLAEGEIDALLEKAKQCVFRLATAAEGKRYDLTDGELMAIECLRVRSLTERELVDRGGLEEKRARALLYFLLVSKQAEAIDLSGVRPAYRPPAAASVPAGPHTRPTRPEMPAVGSAPRISLTPEGEQSESGRWRAVAPAVPYTSEPRIAISQPPQPESGTVEVSSPTSASSATSSSPPRITMGGVSTTGRPMKPVTPPQEWMVSASDFVDRARSSSRIPAAAPVGTMTPARAFAASRAFTPARSFPAAREVTPAVASRALSTPPTTGPSRTLTPPVSRASLTPHPSTASLDTRVVRELASRRQSIFERARAILKEDHYQRLSLPRDASMSQVEQAFTALRTLWDPELLPPALEEAKADCAFVMTCLQEAHVTLRNPSARAEYSQRVTLSALRAPSDQVEEDLAASGSADPLEGAQICFARGEIDRAERLARRASRVNPDQGMPLALLAWIEATRPQNQTVEETRKRIAVLDKALRLDETMTEAYYWRAQLHKRIENHSAAMRDFRKVVELQPSHIEAVRELRVYQMRIRRNSITMKAVK